jgi:hypothetical protein
MTRARKPAPKSETSFEPKRSQFAPRPFAPPVEVHEPPSLEPLERASQFGHRFGEVSIFPRPVVQPIQGKSARGPTGTTQAKEEAPPNRTWMPDRLKSGIESLSGLDLSGVRVHYSSSKPAQLNALAYTQGREIHLAPGQEGHLPHEAWHVVQQAEGRVKPTIQTKDGVLVNDDEGLEREADVMGAKALATLLKGDAYVHCKARKDHVPVFAASTAVKFRTADQGVPALLQMYDPKKKEKSRIIKLRNEYVRLNNDDDYFADVFDEFVKNAKSMEDIEKFVSDKRNKQETTAPMAAAAPISVGVSATATTTVPKETPSKSTTRKKGRRAKPMAAEASMPAITTTTVTTIAPEVMHEQVAPAPTKQSEPLRTQEEMPKLTSPAPKATPSKLGGKKKTKYVPLSIFGDVGQTPAPKPSAWQKPLDIKGAASTKPVTGPPSTMLVDEESMEVPNNKFIKDLIAGKGNFTVKSIEVDGGQTTETVYYNILVLGPIQQPGEGRMRQFRCIYTLYLHYHPDPPKEKEKNWLHIKRAHGGPPENTVTVNNWLFANHMEILRQGMIQWENSYGKEATKRF